MATTTSPQPLRIHISGSLVIPAEVVAALPGLGALPLAGLIGTAVSATGGALDGLAVALGADAYSISVTNDLAGGVDLVVAADPEA